LCNKRNIGNYKARKKKKKEARPKLGTPGGTMGGGTGENEDCGETVTQRIEKKKSITKR
jgi:hypothetical protein